MTSATLEVMRAVKALEPCTSSEIAIYLNGRMTRRQILVILNIGIITGTMRMENDGTRQIWTLTPPGQEIIEGARD